MGDWPIQGRQEGRRGLLSPIGGATPFADLLAIIANSKNATTQGWPLANRAIYQPVFVPYPVTITDAIVTVVTQAGNIDIGLYGWQGNRLVSSGSTAVGAAGVQVVGLADTAVLPGWYKLAMACDSLGAVFRGSIRATQDSRICGLEEESSAFPLPSSATPTILSVAYNPDVALGYRATI